MRCLRSLCSYISGSIYRWPVYIDRLADWPPRSWESFLFCFTFFYILASLEQSKQNILSMMGHCQRIASFANPSDTYIDIESDTYRGRLSSCMTSEFMLWSCRLDIGLPWVIHTSMADKTNARALVRSQPIWSWEGHIGVSQKTCANFVFSKRYYIFVYNKDPKAESCTS